MFGKLFNGSFLKGGTAAITVLSLLLGLQIAALAGVAPPGPYDVGWRIGSDCTSNYPAGSGSWYNCVMSRCAGNYGHNPSGTNQNFCACVNGAASQQGLRQQPCDQYIY